MVSIIIIQALILVVTVLLACAAIYAAEAADVFDDDSSSGLGIHNQGSIERNVMIGSASPVHGADHVNMPIVYV